MASSLAMTQPISSDISEDISGVNETADMISMPDLSKVIASYKGHKIAVLLATGFNESDFLMVQKSLRECKADFSLISPDTGLVTSWQVDGWGHNYMVDNPLNKSLAADFSMCIILGGQRAMDKLSSTAHSSRFVKGFVMTQKPVMTMNEANDFIDGLDANMEGVSISDNPSMVRIQGNGNLDKQHMDVANALFDFAKIVENIVIEE